MHNFKQHLIVEQKLLHFVDAFHQYVMDRVSWVFSIHSFVHLSTVLMTQF
jgi:hypothetical protein